ncbi:hypothetical protein [Streptomyces noursei]
MPGPVTIKLPDGSTQPGPEKGDVTIKLPATATGNQEFVVTSNDDPTKTTTVGFNIDQCSGGGAVTASVACDPGVAGGLGVTLTVTGATQPVKVKWDAASAEEDVTGGTAKHSYAGGTTGPQTLTVTHGGQPVTVTGSPITIPCSGGGAVTAAVACDAGVPGGLGVTLTVTGATGPVKVKWDAAGAEEDVTGGTAKHTYPGGTTGAQAVSVTHNAQPVTVTGSPITIPCSGGTGPTAQPTPDPTNGLKTTLALSGFSANTTSVKINWGDGTPEQTGVAVSGGSGTTDHTYDAGKAGQEQSITVTSEQQPTETATAKFTPKSGGGGGALTGTQTCDTTDTNGLTVLVKADNSGEGGANKTVNISAPGAESVGGAAGTTGTNAGNNTATTAVKYPTGTTAAQTITLTGVATASRTTTVQVPTLPCTGGGGAFTVTTTVNRAQNTVSYTIEPTPQPYKWELRQNGTKVADGGANAPAEGTGAAPSSDFGIEGRSGDGYTLYVEEQADATKKGESAPFSIPAAAAPNRVKK